MKKTYLQIGLIAVSLFVIDQFCKWLIINYLDASRQILPWLSLVFEQNYGIAWSLPLPSGLILPLNLILFIVIIGYLPRLLDMRRKLSIIALALIAGGALGNIFDRFAYGYVVDFISVGWWPVFNLADVFLSIGIFLILLFYGTIKRQN